MGKKIMMFVRFAIISTVALLALTFSALATTIDLTAEQTQYTLEWGTTTSIPFLLACQNSFYNCAPCYKYINGESAGSINSLPSDSTQNVYVQVTIPNSGKGRITYNLRVTCSGGTGGTDSKEATTYVSYPSEQQWTAYQQKVAADAAKLNRQMKLRKTGIVTSVLIMIASMLALFYFKRKKSIRMSEGKIKRATKAKVEAKQETTESHIKSEKHIKHALLSVSFILAVISLAVIAALLLHKSEAGISKEQAEKIVKDFLTPIYENSQSGSKVKAIGNTYKEGNYWVVGVYVDKLLLYIDVNVQTGRMEYVRYDGKSEKFDVVFS